MAIPEPKPGLVLRYDYLWTHEAAAGQDQGKDRPACLVAATDALVRPRHVVLLPITQQRRFVDAVEAVAPGRGFLLYSYCVTSPLPARKLGLTARREAWTPLNLPPASVWRYCPAG